MLRYRDVVGLPVICITTGRKIADVKDLLFSTGNKKFMAVLVGIRGMLKEARVILKEDIRSIGKDAVIVSDEKCIRPASFDEEINRMTRGRKRLMEERVYTMDGKNLGYIKDILFDFETGNMEGFVMSDGIIQDVVTGRHLVPLFGRVEFGSEHIFVGREAEEEMIHDGGGIVNIIEKQQNFPKYKRDD